LGESIFSIVREKEFQLFHLVILPLFNRIILIWNKYTDYYCEGFLEIMSKALEFILSKFPDQRGKITNIYNQDEDFRIICEDYLTSMQALLESRLNLTKNKDFENEFLDAYLELEKEIIHLLERTDKQ
jgi:hypothetical protein